MKYMKDTAETARLYAEWHTKCEEIRSRYSQEVLDTRDCGYYEEETFSSNPVIIEAAALNRQLEEIRKEYEPKISDSRVIATATEEEEAEARELWGEFYDAINAMSEMHPEHFV